MPLPPPIPSLPPETPRRWSVAFKLAAIAVLIILLQVPLVLIHGTLKERRATRDRAIAEIADTWGAAQTIVGPVLAVPFTMPERTQRESVSADRVYRTEEIRQVEGVAWFLPDRIEVDGGLETEVRYRGIFRAPVYTARLNLSGTFQPDVAALELPDAAMQWSRARVLIGLSDARGLRSAPAWQGAGGEATFAPGVPRPGWPHVIEVGLAANGAGDLVGDFSTDLVVQGSQRVAFAPIGASTRVRIEGAWGDPSFDGRYLPVTREIAADRFSARWETAEFGRGFPQQWADHPDRPGVSPGILTQTAFGVTLATPVDAYRLVERSLKYAILFLVLVFAVFFLFEVIADVRLHAVQYLMVGAALALFYLGFLALGEFLGSGWAYAVAATASTALITGYCGAVLRTGRRAASVGLGLAATYGYLYFILQLQDYALVAGTAALFALLAVAMWLTRRLDWNAIDLGLKPRVVATVPRSET